MVANWWPQSASPAVAAAVVLSAVVDGADEQVDFVDQAGVQQIRLKGAAAAEADLACRSRAAR